MAYQGKATFGLEEMFALIVSDRPTTISREREDFSDKFRGKTVATAGPYTVRIEPFKVSRLYPTFDEKGSTAGSGYILTGLNLPREVSEGVPTFRINDTIIDADGNRYRVSGPPRFVGNLVEVNIDLLG